MRKICAGRYRWSGCSQRTLCYNDYCCLLWWLAKYPFLLNILRCFRKHRKSKLSPDLKMKKKRSFPTNYVQEYRRTIGKTIRSIREERGFSQDELAEIMKVHRSTISKIETGKFAMTIDYLVKFAWYLDFDIALVEKVKWNANYGGCSQCRSKKLQYEPYQVQEY